MDVKPIASLTGIPGLYRGGYPCPDDLLQVAGRAAELLYIDPGTARFVVVLLGESTSVAAMSEGSIQDSESSAEDGPLSLTESGRLPAKDVITLCFESGLAEQQVMDVFSAQAGIAAYTGARTAEEFIAACNRGDERALLAAQILAYQVSKEAGAMAVMLGGKPDALVLSGSLVKCDHIMNTIRSKCGYIGRVLEV